VWGCAKHRSGWGSGCFWGIKIRGGRKEKKRRKTTGEKKNLREGSWGCPGEKTKNKKKSESKHPFGKGGEGGRSELGAGKSLRKKKFDGKEKIKGGGGFGGGGGKKKKRGHKTKAPKIKKRKVGSKTSREGTKPGFKATRPE